MMTTWKQTRELTEMRADAIRIALGVILSALSGILLLLAFPPYGLWPLIWVAFVPYVFSQHRLFPRKWSGLATSLAMACWLGPYLARIFGDGMGIFFKYLGIWIAILSFFLSRERYFHEMTHYRWFVWQGVINWVGFEMIRTFIPLLATNGFVGYTLASQAWLIQPVSLFGVYGLNLMIMFINFGLSQTAMAWFDRNWQPEGVVAVDQKASRRWMVAIGIGLNLWIGLSLVILWSAPDDSPTIRIAALQPNFPQAAHVDKETPAQLRLDTFFDQAGKAAQMGAEVIFTPEMGFAFDPQLEHTEALQELAAETGAYLFLTYVVSDETGFRNEAVMLSPDGEFSEVYGKNHIFGEPATPSAGVYPVYQTALGRMATMICHDANYTDVARKLTRNGAQLIAAPTREFGGVGEQLWTNSVFRAVENRVAVIYTGVAKSSAVIDPFGRLLALRLNPEGERITLVRDVPLGSGGSLLVHLGDWIGWVCLAGYVFFTIYPSVVKRRLQASKT